MSGKFFTPIFVMSKMIDAFEIEFLRNNGE